MTRFLNSGETFGVDSRCFESSVKETSANGSIHPACFEIDCDVDDADDYFITIGTHKVLCTGG
jgi:hypothetical protein